MGWLGKIIGYHPQKVDERSFPPPSHDKIVTFELAVIQSLCRSSQIVPRHKTGIGMGVSLSYSSGWGDEAPRFPIEKDCVTS